MGDGERMTEDGVSKNGIKIRLPDERWEHIMQRHDVLATQKTAILETISQPERILRGSEGAMMAVRAMEPGRWLVVIYREEQDDGFVITAFPTRRINALNRRQQLWP